MYGLGNLLGIGWSRGVTGHNHCGAFFSEPIEHEDQWHRLRAWKREVNMFCGRRSLPQFQDAISHIRWL